MTDVPAGTAYRDKKVGGWMAELRWPARGIRRRWRGQTKREAVAQMEKYRRELGSGLKPEATTFDRLADVYLAAHRRTARPATVTQAEWALSKARPHIGHMLVADIVPSDIERVLHAAEDDGLGPRSRRAIRSQMRNVMGRAVADRLVLANPVDGVKGPKATNKRLDLPPLALVHELLDDMKEADHPSWPLLHVIASTALRTSEARSLRWSDVDDDFIHVRGQLDRSGAWSRPKTDAGVRNIPITPRCRAALEAMKARQKGLPSVYVFADGKGNVPAPWTAYKAWSRSQERAWGKERLTVHGLRHLGLSALVDAGVPLADIAKFAGHADIRILMEVYVDAMDGHQERIRDGLSAGGLG